MNNRKLHILIFMLLLSVVMLKAQSSSYYYGIVNTSGVQIDKNDDIVNIKFNIDLKNLSIGHNQLVTLTPNIENGVQKESLDLAPILIVGKTRNIVMQRTGKYGEAGNDVLTSVKEIRIGHSNLSETISYLTEIPYQEWMKGAKLDLKFKLSGCASCAIAENTYPVTKFNFIEIPKVHNLPLYNYSYTVPESEKIKRRETSFVAHISFKIGKWDILPFFGNNPSELQKVDNAIGRMNADKNLKIEKYTVKGYASPDGAFASNLNLSSNRAKAFAIYIGKKYNIPQDNIDVKWFGEDWDGLRKALSENPSEENKAIVEMIDNTIDVNTRKVKLKRLNGGQTYKTLTSDYFPELRRIEYSIRYSVKPFDNLDEAKEILNTKPELLSVAEMYMIAKSYGLNLKEQRKVMDIAAKTYPDNPLARINAAVAALDDNDNDTVIKLLNKASTAEEFNILGIVYSRQENYPTAEEYFSKAANMGLRSAKDNLNRLKKWLEEEEQIRKIKVR